MFLNIKSFSRITNNFVSLNGQIFPIESRKNPKMINLEDIYRHFKIEYLKFFKMDSLAKAAFLGAELVCKDINIDRTISKKDIAIVCFNRSSSLDNDMIYQNTIQDSENYFPSPSLFVYTLGNILTGEIAIRNKIEGETSFYVTENFSPELMHETIEAIFENKSINGLLCGWTEYFNDFCDILIMYIEKSNDNKNVVTKDNISNCYNNILWKN
ncbi:MAG: hypothetical protein FWH18_03450 [Marinilabiliaceae bacterium]|nr:hypothetical protein [Marinilabiliaceae bacterium]